jgi:hypothetical protein
MNLLVNLIKRTAKQSLNNNNYYSIWDYEKKYRFFYKEFLYLFLLAYIKNKTSFNFIQVGAYDGKSNDPLYFFLKENKKNSSGIFFEPQILPYKKLVKNYRGYKNFYFSNKAVGFEGKFPFYKLNKKFYKDFSQLGKNNGNITNFSGLNSFYIDNLISRFKKFKNFNAKKHILTEILPVCNVIKEIKICLKNRANTFLKKIDLLQIDAEGYDDIVIYSCNLNILNPTLINFEHKNLSRIKQLKLNKYLLSKHYRTFVYSRSDTLAIRQ